MDIFLQLVLNGLLLGGTLAIISIGLTLIFGIVRVVNFAHGEFLMIGLYAVYLMNTKFGIHPYVAIIPTTILLFAAGAAMQRFIIQPLLSAEGHIQIFATVGVSIALMNGALLMFGADVKTVQDISLGTGSVVIGPFRASSGQLITFAASMVMVAGLHWFLHSTFLGRAVRATAQHRNAAQLMGVDVKKIYIFAFGLGCACLGVASGLIAPQYPVFPTVGTFFVLTAFVIVVLGGLGSLSGALMGSMVIGVVDSLAGYYIAPDLKEVVYFSIFLAILVFRPTGLFGAGRGSE
ncbi:branched-chain amino acid ABC transporter permease [Pseudomonas monteilii]|uniref:Branched-chain amino acid ABC transporter permease n=1 Tax=Pseudomonas monteilii TaxID=76759 RepID=A0AAP7FS62_9PSED|nr:MULTISPECIES: branched-chain amino acid ABC transporter permease [Pseudomonas]MCV4076480.1 branched-chain amino acid ABC transporter permease [Pseudomonas aeruginosa]OAH57075.1 branched-chain amino acid ABC transporter permease [Pseudomonas monteilii]